MLGRPPVDADRRCGGALVATGVGEEVAAAEKEIASTEADMDRKLDVIAID